MFKYFCRKVFYGLVIMLHVTGNVFAQPEPLFTKAPLDSLGIRCYELLSTKGGSIRIMTSAGLGRFAENNFQIWRPNQDELLELQNALKGIKLDKLIHAQDSVRAMAESPDGVLFFATKENTIFFSPNSELVQFWWPPFIFPPKGEPFDKIASLYIDNSGDLFIGTYADNMYLIKEGAHQKYLQDVDYKIVDGAFVYGKGERPVKKIILAPQTGVFSFAPDNLDKNIIWIGTDHGLYRYNKAISQGKNIIPINVTNGLSFTVTHIEFNKQGGIWFSTLEKGMGFYDQQKNSIQFYPYAKKNSNIATQYPVKTFCYKTDNDFFVAVMDSLPAIFNTKTGAYTFINDASLKQSADNTTDIKVDKYGNLFLIKGGALYTWYATTGNVLSSTINPDSAFLEPYIKYVKTLNGIVISAAEWEWEHNIHELKLNYNQIQNPLYIGFGVNDFNSVSNNQFAYKIDGVTNGWILTTPMNMDSSGAIIQGLKPGKYLFELKVKTGDEDWRRQQAKLIIIVSPPFWLTWWFWAAVILGLGLIIGLIMWWRISAVKKRVKEKFAHEKQLMELEVLALRAQMNPHFIFNCLNSIKSLMQEQDTEKGITYLTTFSKLIRTLFNNADKKLISLYDEIETCKFYLQLEALRFDAKFTYAVNVDETIDLKSVQVPALIIQPFIENAIWHGIVPRNSTGHVILNVLRKDECIEIVIEDNGIGREASQQNKSASSLAHQSKGVNLTKSRLELNNQLQQLQAELQTIDKIDENGMATGTTVIIKIKEEV